MSYIDRDAGLVSLAATSRSPAFAVLTLQPLDLDLVNPMPQELGGALCAANSCVNVNYPASLFSQGVGVAALNAALRTTPGPVVVFGGSEGAQVASDWVAKYADTVAAPTPSKVSFVLIGNPSAPTPVGRQTGGPLYPNIPANNPYQITDVARQYDGWADWPNNSGSAGYQKAALNALIGMATIHDDYFSVDLNSAGNARRKQGNATYIIVPTQTLPMLQPLQNSAPSAQTLAQNAQSKPVVDSAYTYPVPLPEGFPADVSAKAGFTR